ncbi:hypothetical protein ACVU7I_02310 [Patulibacter sp. S7RM1-6]
MLLGIIFVLVGLAVLLVPGLASWMARYNRENTPRSAAGQAPRTVLSARVGATVVLVAGVVMVVVGAT